MQDFGAKIEELFENNDVWILNSEINRPLYFNISKQLEDVPNRKNNAILYIVTYGGDPHSAFRIARAFKHYYQNLKIIIPSFCKSAGTLIAMGADSLAIGDMGELGPLDVQVTKSNEFIERVSGLEIKESLDSLYQHAHYVFSRALVDVKMGTRVSMKMAGEIATQFAIGVVNPLYSQIDPNRIGELSRAMKIAECYGRILNDKSKNLQDGALEKIISGYPSHSFVIDRKEASTLFTNINDMNAVEKDIFKSFEFLLVEPKEKPFFVMLDSETVINFYNNINGNGENDELNVGIGRDEGSVEQPDETEGSSDRETSGGTGALSKKRTSKPKSNEAN